LNKSSLDAICIGEGEDAFADLLRALSERQSLSDIPNIITKGKSTDRSMIRNLVDDLDKLPFPDYGLLYDNTPMGGYPLKNFIASRGCPYDCTYCFNAEWRKLYKGKGKAVRRHSVDYVIENILIVKKKWPLTTVKFYDDIFAFKADSWLEEFSKKYKALVGLPFFVLTRPDLLNEETVKLLKSAGCRTISMSIEAGNPEVRSKVLKRNMSDEQIIRAHRLCDKYGIHTFSNCIVGLPGTKIEHDIESIDLAIKCKLSWVEFLIFHPYPGTELGNRAVQEGIYEPDYGSMHTSYMYSSELKCFSKREKNTQQNIAELGAVAVIFPVFRNLIVRYLIFWPHNKLFILVYWAVKMYVIRNRIYVTKTTVLKSLQIYFRSLIQEVFRHTKEKTK